ncbi:MAG: hypothetical protein HMLIMOIP_002221 [Candidatus Nitrosomirales archaeon]
MDALFSLFQKSDATALSETYDITKVRSGLVSSDTFTTGNLENWILHGSAIPRKAPYEFYVDSTGLHLGIEAANSTSWAGYFAEAPSTNAYLFHAIVTLPYTTISDNVFNTGLYVQTTYKGLVNYVACVAHVDPSGYHWSLILATGSQDGADNFTTLWADYSSNQPLTRDCTIITNGENYLKAYLDGVPIYSNSTHELNMPAPFYAFVEVQTTSSSQMRFGTYTDYYSTLNKDIAVINGPVDGKVRLTDSLGNIIANAITDGGGNARLDIGMHRMPLENAYIQVYDSVGKELLTWNPNGEPLWGGDVYFFGTAQLPSVQICIPRSTLDSLNVLSP